MLNSKEKMPKILQDALLSFGILIIFVCAFLLVMDQFSFLQVDHLISKGLLLFVIFCMGCLLYIVSGNNSKIISKIKQNDNNKYMKIIARLESKRWLTFCILMTIIIIGIAIRIKAALTANLDLDEGLWGYDAQLILQGKIPLADYATGAPLLLYMLALIFKIFGSSFFYGRILIILFTALNSYLVFYLCKRLLSFSTGILAMIFYTFLPFNIYHTYIIHNPEVSITFCLLSIVFLIRFFERRSLFYTFLIGLTVGLGYLVRRTVFIYLVLAFIMILFDDIFVQKKLNFKSLLKYFLLGLGFVIAMSLLYYFVLFSSWDWLNRAYGFASLTRDAASVSQNVYHNFFGEGIVSYVNSERLRIVSRTVVVDNILAIPALFSVLIFIKHRRIQLLWIYIVNILIVILLTFHFANLSQRDFLLNLTNISKYSYAILSIYLLIIINLSLRDKILSDRINRKRDLLSFIALLWLVLLFLSYLVIKTEFLEGYLFEFIPVLSILSALLLVKIGKNQPKYILSFAILVFAFFIISGIDFIRTKPYARSLDTKDLMAAANYVKENTNSNESIFTGDSELAFLSNRKIIDNFTRYSIYGCMENDPVPSEVDPKDVIPSFSKIVEDIDKNVRLIVAGTRTYAVITCQPKLQDEINKRFQKQICFGSGICIYEKKPMK